MINLATAITISIIGIPVAIILAIVFYSSVLMQAFKYFKTHDKR